MLKVTDIREGAYLQDAMAAQCEGHIAEDRLEAYSLGCLPEDELAPLEEHLLVCPACQDRLRAADAFVATIRQALQQLASN
jgi:anti-sigma factor RsiW